MPSSEEMWKRRRYTLLVNNTKSQLTLESDGTQYIVAPKGYVIIRWHYQVHTCPKSPLLKFSTGDTELSPVFTSHDLYANKRIVIFGDLGTSPSCRMTRRKGPHAIDCFSCRDYLLFLEWINGLLRTMEKLETKVRIWYNQCKHLLKKYQEAVDRLERVGLEFENVSERDLKHLFMASEDPTHERQRYLPISLDRNLSSLLISSLCEGHALLLSCGEASFDQAAFALTSVPPSVPTFSKFSLAIRELNWAVDFLCCFIEGKPPRLDSWEWCEERRRLVSPALSNRLDASEDESLEADALRQNADREALQSALDQKLSKSPSTSSNFLNPATWLRRRRADASVESELESIWRKRLQASSCAPGSYSPDDPFVIDNPDTSFVPVTGSRSKNGTSKSVQKCKWLGKTVALATISNVSKVSAQAEIGFLARVQHPNVVEWMGYGFKEDRRNPSCYQECFLVTEHMECDLDELITEHLTGDDGTIINNRSPFQFSVAVDIALQIVEAMIHVHRCRVIHRDLKPKNILASRKHSLKDSEKVPSFYTIKLIDFGSSKSGDQGSHFDTRKQGTPLYMAPEVWESEGRSSYSWSADVYSFGLTCFEIFTGKLPLKSGMTSTYPNLQKVLRGRVLFPVWIPAGLKALIERCWAQNPSDRPRFQDIRKALWRLKLNDFATFALA